jgi:hypothetical protein
VLAAASRGFAAHTIMPRRVAFGLRVAIVIAHDGLAVFRAAAGEPAPSLFAPSTNSRPSR